MTFHRTIAASIAGIGCPARPAAPRWRARFDRLGQAFRASASAA